MRITFDPVKRAATLQERGLDFADAAEIFADDFITRLDERFDHGEDRFITVGTLAGRLVVMVWTPRDDVAQIPSGFR